MNINFWSNHEDNLIKSNYGCSEEQWKILLPLRKYKSIKDRACQLGFSKKRKKWSENDIELLKNNYFALSNSKLQILFNNSFSYSEISRKAISLGLKKQDVSWNNDEDNYLLISYLTTSKKEILNKLHSRSWNAIISRAGVLGIGSRRSCGLIRKYYCDFDFFNQIDTEEKAYWLGFIYADGNIHNNSLRISLVVDGKKQLEKFKASIKYTGDVKGPYYVSSKNKGGEKTKYTLEIRHRGMCEDLSKHGVIPNKTFQVQLPQLDSNLYKHFIRGVFDGDGTTSIKTTKYKEKIYTTPTFSICGGVSKFLEDIVQILVEQVGVTQNVVIKPKITKYDKNLRNSTACHFSYQGAPSLRIRDWMYEDASVWMDCKRDKFFSWDYPSVRPRDKKHQEIKIDEIAQHRGWKRVSEYLGYYNRMSFECDKGHVFETSVSTFKTNHGCPHCADLQAGERMTNLGKDNLAEALKRKGWKLLSEYSREGDIKILCEHGVEFKMRRKCAVKSHAKCECDRTNTLQAGEKSLLLLLNSKGWKLISKYDGIEKYITIECQHGKQFQRLGINIKPLSKCDCDKVSSSGYKGVYLSKSGRWQACAFENGKQKSIGTFQSVEEAVAARQKYGV